MSKYVENEELKEFPSKILIEANNKILGIYYDYLKTTFPELQFVSSPGIGDKDHTWGLSPVHYTNDYYSNIYDQIMRIK